MNKKLLWLFTLLFLVAGSFVEAQQALKVPRIGVIHTGSPPRHLRGNSSASYTISAT